ncbi:synaptic vesicle glycoprotein 2C-like [Hetaerina americana]|uniref:synaptic vesicle glycoprotein 2C-like n=1 Tax=Hetaerina americana TaxID=62018 RepID=UPI003A7F1614
MKVLSEERRGKASLGGVVDGLGPVDSRVHLAFIRIAGDPDDPANSLDKISDKNGKQKEEVCADFETAIKMTGSGKFTVLLIAVCGSVFANAGISTTVISFVLPSAQCDFQLTSEDKGRLNAAPNTGMLLGALIWGLLADARGRKRMIISGLLLDAFFTLISSLTQNYWIFLVSRIICGFGTAATVSLLFAYMGEFLPLATRDRSLCGLELSWSIAITILPGIAAAVIPQTWAYEFGGGFLILNSWRVFIMMCALPSLTNALCLAFLPEAPRYLMSKNRLEEALQAFQWIHHINMGKDREYAVTSLRPSPPAPEGPKVGRPCEPYSALASQARALFSQPLLTASALTLIVQTLLMTCYHTLILWFPDLFDRYDRFLTLYPNQTVASICEVTAAIAGGDDALPCDSDGQAVISATAYHHATIVGVACIVAGVAIIAVVDRLGKRAVMVGSMVISGVCTIGLNYVWTSTQNLILACIFEAIAGLGISVIMCVVVELIPPNHRAFALALEHTTGRIGAVIGNILFGWLVDFNCDIPLIAGGVLLIGGGLLSLFIPKPGEKYQHQ